MILIDFPSMFEQSEGLTVTLTIMGSPVRSGPMSNPEDLGVLILLLQVTP